MYVSGSHWERLTLQDMKPGPSQNSLPLKAALQELERNTAQLQDGSGPKRKHISEHLLSQLMRYNQNLPASDSVAEKSRKNLLLRLENTAREHIFTVTSGQQVGIFISPLLALYKALAVVALAERLDSGPDTQVFPVFWLQSEDHDFEEIARTNLITGSDRLRGLQLPGSRFGGRIPVGELSFGEEIETVRSEFIEHLPNGPYTERTARLLEYHYKAGANPVKAFAGLLGDLLGKNQLIFFDPRSFPLAKEAAGVFETALKEQDSLERLLVEQSNAEKKATQVELRDGSPLFFFQPAGRAGARYRLQRTSGGTLAIEATQKSYSDAEILKCLRETPEKFSSSALLRPVVQDAILPNLAYIAGPSEQRYLQQIEPLYPAFGVTRSAVLPRPKVLIIEPKVKKYLEKEGLSLETALGPESELESFLAERNLARFASQGHAGVVLPEELERRLATLKEQTASLLAELGPALPEKALSGDSDPDETALQIEKTADKTLAALDYHFEKLTRRYTAAVARMNTVSSRRSEFIRTQLLPGGRPQERTISALYFTSRFSDSVTEILLHAVRSEWLNGEENLSVYLGTEADQSEEKNYNE